MITVSLVVCVIGLIVFLWLENPESPRRRDIKEVGRICFWVGLLALLLTIGSKPLI